MKSPGLFRITEKDKEKNAHQPSMRVSDKGFTLPEQRHTTDVLFLIFIICMWITMTVVGAIACQRGSPYRLLAPMDDSGSVCGYDASVKTRPKFYAVLQNGVKYLYL